jgi:hypothetical protein
VHIKKEGIRQMNEQEPCPQELLKEINQLLLDIEFAEEEHTKEIIKKFAILKADYLKGLIKGL